VSPAGLCATRGHRGLAPDELAYDLLEALRLVWPHNLVPVVLLLPIPLRLQVGSQTGLRPSAATRHALQVKSCLSIKGAEDTINKPHAFEVSTTECNLFFIADSDKEKEDWINAVGRSIVRHSRSLLDQEQSDYS